MPCWAAACLWLPNAIILVVLVIESSESGLSTVRDAPCVLPAFTRMDSSVPNLAHVAFTHQGLCQRLCVHALVRYDVAAPSGFQK